MFVRNIENKRWIMTNTNKINILEKESIRKLIFKFSIPAIVGGLINALYNIADQIFIGQKVGVLGNAATNVAFPITTFCIATMLLLSVGTASNFSIRKRNFSFSNFWCCYSNINSFVFRAIVIFMWGNRSIFSVCL